MADKIEKIKYKRKDGKDLIKLKALKKFWFITKHPTDNSVVHYGFVDEGQELVTGQQTVEDFEDETSYKDKLADLGIAED